MAGRHTGFSSSGSTLGFGYNPKLTRAYAEGRRSFPSASNPHTSGQPVYTAWQHGYDNRADSSQPYKAETQG